MTDCRQQQGDAWVKSLLGETSVVRTLAGDASFRRYFRVLRNPEHFVLMDAPPGKEDITSFLKVRAWLADAGLRVPELIHADREQGFLLLEDFGDRTWALHLITGDQQSVTPDNLFKDALSQLTALQGSDPPAWLPVFDIARMRRECDLYLEWYLPLVAGYVPGDSERDAFYQAVLPLLREIEALPYVPVHLDYHSRNLMLPGDALPLGVIDFQDAVSGPVTYDLASLLYDCYQYYPEESRRLWSRRFYDSLASGQRGMFDGFESWHRAVRLTAMQRHIKATGIFSRLAHRDGKRQFLDEIPLTRLHLLEELDYLGLKRQDFPLLFVAPEQANSEMGYVPD
ncbi:MAG: phosphotransferase [Mariprofundaceae bacterium]|nr:phosphotransferase [Mariprofundaceae bacterium]